MPRVTMATFGQGTEKWLETAEEGASLSTVYPFGTL